MVHSVQADGFEFGGFFGVEYTGAETGTYAYFVIDSFDSTAHVIDFFVGWTTTGQSHAKTKCTTLLCFFGVFNEFVDLFNLVFVDFGVGCDGLPAVSAIFAACAVTDVFEAVYGDCVVKVVSSDYRCTVKKSHQVNLIALEYFHCIVGVD